MYYHYHAYSTREEEPKMNDKSNLTTIGYAIIGKWGSNNSNKFNLKKYDLVWLDFDIGTGMYFWTNKLSIFHSKQEIENIKQKLTKFHKEKVIDEKIQYVEVKVDFVELIF